MEPLTAILGVANASRQLLGGLVDRWTKVRDAKIDATALQRLLLIEIRHNLALLEVALRVQWSKASDDLLWHVPRLLRFEVLEAVLGTGKQVAELTAILKKLVVEDQELVSDSGGVFANIYVRIVALQGLAELHKSYALTRTKIRQRLRNLHRDLNKLRGALSVPERPRHKS